jgi:p21-activated kinase 1
MDETKPPVRRLTKKKPPSTSNLFIDVRNNAERYLRSQKSSASLQRSPSAPSYPRYHISPSHTRTASANPTSYASSNSSLERRISGPSPILAGSESVVPSGQGGGKRTSNPTSPLNEKTSDELVGAPFDGSGILNHLDSTKATGYHTALRRPPPPPLSYTSPEPRLAPQPPPLRQSASFSAGDRTNEKTPPRIADNQVISPKRYSDESKEPKQGMLKKKSGFSGFMNSIGVGSPRGVKISAPENPVHVTHVGYDNQTGQFTVSLILQQSVLHKS